MAFYRLEVIGEDGRPHQFKSPLTAKQAYARTLSLRRRGFIEVVAIDMTTGRRITDVQRLLRDLDQ